MSSDKSPIFSIAFPRSFDDTNHSRDVREGRLVAAAWSVNHDLPRPLLHSRHDRALPGPLTLVCLLWLTLADGSAKLDPVFRLGVKGQIRGRGSFICFLHTTKSIKEEMLKRWGERERGREREGERERERVYSQSCGRQHQEQF